MVNRTNIVTKYKHLKTEQTCTCKVEIAIHSLLKGLIDFTHRIKEVLNTNSHILFKTKQYFKSIINNQESLNTQKCQFYPLRQYQ